MPAEPEQVMTIEELAAYLKVAKSTLYKLAQEGKVSLGTGRGRSWAVRYARARRASPSLPR
tara:strand:+ start:21521 stop:21703 length:183 start_codon:yes stop_codon:yes gene_type:complete